MLGQREALPSDLYRKCKFFEEEGGDLPRSESCSDGEEEEEEGEKPWKSNGDSQGVVQGCTPVTSACLLTVSTDQQLQFLTSMSSNKHI